ncbi:MAG TPA: hypothetical protein DEF68_05960 [Elusimicrobia bacterium]|nr:hypothetical protein [Elusimicrobiota bacterium]
MRVFAVNVLMILNSGQITRKISGFRSVLARFCAGAPRNPQKVDATFALKSALAGFWPTIKRLSNVPYVVLLVYGAGGVCAAAEKNILSAAPKERREALAELVGSRGEKAVPQLIKSLGDGDPGVRGDATRSLGRLKSGKAVVPLTSRLKSDTSSSVRGQAALALAEIGDRKAVPALVQCFKDKSAGVKGYCVRALGILRAKEAVAPLAGLMAGANADFKAQVLNSLGKVGSPEAGGAVKTELEDLRAKRAGGAKIDQPLLVEEEAIRALGEIGGADAVPLVKKGLDSPDDRIRAVSCRALLKLNDKSGLPVCLGLLSHSEAGIRREIAEALAESGDASTTGAVQEALRVEPNPVVRRILESALDKSGR